MLLVRYHPGKNLASLIYQRSWLQWVRFKVLLALLKFGIVSKYFSQPMLRGFNTAAAIHVFTTQMQHVFGIYKKTKPTKIFKLIYV